MYAEVAQTDLYLFCVQRKIEDWLQPMKVKSMIDSANVESELLIIKYYNYKILTKKNNSFLNYIFIYIYFLNITKFV